CSSFLSFPSKETGGGSDRGTMGVRRALEGMLSAEKLLFLASRASAQSRSIEKAKASWYKLANPLPREKEEARRLRRALLQKVAHEEAQAAEATLLQA
ncbi:hypothetical protein CSUI_010926, partial [Cystoisospora suis]